MCDCIAKVNEEFRPYNVGVETQSMNTWTDGDAANGVLTHRVRLSTYKCEPSKKPKYHIFPTFCPFCGERYLPHPTEGGR